MEPSSDPEYRVHCGDCSIDCGCVANWTSGGSEPVSAPRRTPCGLHRRCNRLLSLSARLVAEPPLWTCSAAMGHAVPLSVVVCRFHKNFRLGTSRPQEQKRGSAFHAALVRQGSMLN